MKKFAVIALALVFALGSGMAQIKGMKTAKKLLSQGKLSDAVSMIEDVVVNEETANMPDAWALRGKIYLAVAGDPFQLQQIPDAADISKQSFLKAIQINPQESLLLNKELASLRNTYANLGTGKFEQKDYTGALSNFESVVELLNMEPVPNKEEINNFMFNIALAAYLSENMQKAVEAYKVLADAQYPDPDFYVNYCRAHKALGQNEEAAGALEKMIAAFPEEKQVYVNASILFLELQMPDRSSEVLDAALAKWSEDAALHYFIGYAHGQNNDYEKAEKAYLDALAINPDYLDAVINLAVLHVNKGSELNTQARALPFEEEAKYEELMGQSREILNKAIPYLEKWIEQQPENQDVMYTLRSVYLELGKKDKADALTERIKQLGGE